MRKTNTGARRLGRAAALIALGFVSMTLAMPGVTKAGLEPLETPVLAIAGGTGVPGGTVSATLSLGDDVEDAGVSVGIFLRFDPEVLEFTGPVNEQCVVNDRLSETHSVAGMVSGSLVNIEVLVSGVPNPPPPLGDGDIVSCDFRVRAGVPAGTTGLEIEAPFLGDSEGEEIPVRVINGSVEVIESLPTSTPTATATPQPTGTATATATASPPPPTATVTSTPVNTATATSTPPTVATGTATATRTPPTVATGTATVTATRTVGGPTPTATRKKSGGDSGCNVTPATDSDATGTAALLLAPALLIWVRRRNW